MGCAVRYGLREEDDDVVRVCNDQNVQQVAGNDCTGQCKTSVFLPAHLLYSVVTPGPGVGLVKA